MPFTMLCRDSSLQKDSIEEIKQWLKKIETKKREAKVRGDDDVANMLLSVGCALGAVLACIQMCLQLKNDQPHDAWRSLVYSQHAVTSAMRAHRACDNMAGLSEFLHEIEHQLFPPQVFASVGAKFSRAFCSICDSDYRDCNHITGRPYAGDFCSMVIRNSVVEEVSIVETPEDKACIVVSTADKNGRMLDRLSLLPSEDSNKDDD